MSRGSDGGWPAEDYDPDPYCRCRHCGGIARRSAGGGSPAGWYNLTVSVPEWYTDKQFGSGGPYVWVGQFCCIEHLLAHGPHMAEVEARERLAYEAAVPEPPPEPDPEPGPPARGRRTPRP